MLPKTEEDAKNATDAKDAMDKTLFLETMVNKYGGRYKELAQKEKETRERLTAMVPPSPVKKKKSKVNYECECDAPPGIDISLTSIKSEEEVFLRRVLDLKARENALKNEVKSLEEKEQEVEKMLAIEAALCRCSNESKSDAKDERNVFSELSDLQTNLKSYLNKMEGPLAQELQRERDKTRQLENYLSTIQETMESSRKTFMETMEEIKSQFQCKCCEMMGVNSQNANLKQQANILQCQCKQLEKQLFEAKLKEAETIVKLTKMMKKRASAGGDSSLKGISKQLDQSLQETINCQNCKETIPTDYRETVQGIKSLTDLVYEHGKKLEGKSGSGGGLKGVTRELEITGDLNADVETEIKILDTKPTDFKVNTNLTDTGSLEIVTHGPAGTIETTMIYTESGNIEIITEITELDDDGAPLQLSCPPPLLALPCYVDTCGKTNSRPQITSCNDSTCDVITKPKKRSSKQGSKTTHKKSTPSRSTSKTLSCDDKTCSVTNK